MVQGGLPTRILPASDTEGNVSSQRSCPSLRRGETTAGATTLLQNLPQPRNNLDIPLAEPVTWLAKTRWDGQQRMPHCPSCHHRLLTRCREEGTVPFTELVCEAVLKRLVQKCAKQGRRAEDRGARYQAASAVGYPEGFLRFLLVATMVLGSRGVQEAL